METQAELSMLENEYKASIRDYRSLIRQGLDQALETPGDIAQELLSKTRSHLDKSSAGDARYTLNKLASHLNTMRQSFPQAKAHIRGDLKSMITFMNSVIHHPSHAGRPHAGLDQEISTSMEKARFALQSDDWSKAKSHIKQLVDLYLDKQQERFVKENRRESHPEAANTLKQFSEKGASCRSIRLKDIEKLFQLSSQRNSSAIGVGICASESTINDLFSALSKSPFELTQTQNKGEAAAAVLRISIDRQNTLFFVGIPINASMDMISARTVIRFFDTALLDLESTSLTRAATDKLLISCLENVSKEKIFVTRGNGESNSDFLQKSLNSLPSYEDTIDSQSVVAWAKSQL